MAPIPTYSHSETHENMFIVYNKIGAFMQAGGNTFISSIFSENVQQTKKNDNTSNQGDVTSLSHFWKKKQQMYCFGK